MTTGDVVEVPFGSRKMLGIVTADSVSTEYELKTISKNFHINVGEQNFEFHEWDAAYTLIPRGNVLKMILAEKSVFNTKKGIQQVEYQWVEENFDNQEIVKIELNADQQAAKDAIIAAGTKPFLLEGVTGSGKTEIYLSAVQEVVKNHMQALILFPEIVLAGQISDRIKKYFGFRPEIWNSNVSSKKRREIWLGALSGKCPLIIGARSALFLPYKNLGMIVVDEEHDSSYKQEEGGLYHARDMAVVLANLRKIPVILSSATPSLETKVNAISEKYCCANVQTRFGKAKMPSIHLIDMKQNRFDGFVSPVLLDAVKKTLAVGEQCLIYLNRRGYAPITFCRSCGEKLSCPNCTSWLVYHRELNKEVCHCCGYKTDAPTSCKICGGDDFMQWGPGVERISEELRRKLPNTRIEIASSDTLSEKNTEKFLEKIRNKEIEIVIGTQILAKGHHFANITLVGVIDGDLGLYGADIRAGEKTYQMINQVAGRAGRGEKPGNIFIQTFNPEHSLYVALKNSEIEHFLELEIESRQKNKLPPFARLASIIISGTNMKLTETTAKILAQNPPKGIRLLGPAPAPRFLLRGRTRWRILLQAPKQFPLSNLIKNWIFQQSIPKNIRIQIDIDPISFF